MVRLATSGVGDDVVLAYIKNSQAPFNLSADDVLYLKDIGLSPEVTSAMLTPRQHVARPAAAICASAPQPRPQPRPAPVARAGAQPRAPPHGRRCAAPVYVSSPPPDVTYFYNDLAPYGTWVQLDGYGWCWQPTAVVITRGWRPYGDGGYWVYSDLGLVLAVHLFVGLGAVSLWPLVCAPALRLGVDCPTESGGRPG